MPRKTYKMIHIEHTCDEDDCEEHIYCETGGWLIYNEGKYLEKRGWSSLKKGNQKKYHLYRISEKDEYYCPDHARERGLSRGYNVE